MLCRRRVNFHIALVAFLIGGAIQVLPTPASAQGLDLSSLCQVENLDTVIATNNFLGTPFGENRVWGLYHFNCSQTLDTLITASIADQLIFDVSTVCFGLLPFALPCAQRINDLLERFGTRVGIYGYVDFSFQRRVGSSYQTIYTQSHAIGWCDTFGGWVYCNPGDTYGTIPSHVRRQAQELDFWALPAASGCTDGWHRVRVSVDARAWTGNAEYDALIPWSLRNIQHTWTSNATYLRCP